jgi:hypothetical protein
MSQFTPPPPPPPPPPYQPVPPTAPGLLGIPARATKWPTVIGVLAIVLGFFGAACNVCGAFGPTMQGTLESMLPAGSMKDVKTEERWVPWVVAAAGVSVLIGILQIVGGAGLLKRAPWSPAALRTWAVLAIVASLCSTVMYYKMQEGKSHAVVIATSGPAASLPTTLPAQTEKAFLAVGMCMGVVYVCAFPIFVLIWLAREPIRDEIRTWQVAPQ